MGYIAHHTIIVTGYPWQNGVEHLHKLAREVFDGTSCLVTDIYGPVTNGYMAFYVTPDGSKEGWAESDEGDNARDLFMQRVSLMEHACDIVSLRYGGDDPQLVSVENASYLYDDEDEDEDETPTTFTVPDTLEYDGISVSASDTVTVNIKIDPQGNIAKSVQVIPPIKDLQKDVIPDHWK